MKQARRSKLTYANVMSTLCFFLLLSGGAAYAATQLAKNSVGTKQLKKNAVTGAKVKNNSLTGSDIDSSTLGQVPAATAAMTATKAGNAGNAETLQGSPANAFVHGDAQVFSTRNELQIGDEKQVVAVPGIGNVTASCAMGTTNPSVEFTFHNESGGTMDQTLEYSGGTDAGTVPDGGTSGTGAETFAALRMKVATRTSPATIVTFDLNMAANGPSPCSVFVQAIASK